MTSAFLRFLVVGAVGFVVDAGGTWLFIRLGATPLAARVVPLSLSIVCTWLLNRRLTFRFDRPRSRMEFLRYFGVATTGAALNYALYGAFVLAGLDPILSVAAATAILLFYSFFAYRRLVFR